MTSTTITRLWLSAVVCSRSMAMVTQSMAEGLHAGLGRVEQLDGQLALLPVTGLARKTPAVGRTENRAAGRQPARTDPRGTGS
jgi:hypothetical protein